LILKKNNGSSQHRLTANAGFRRFASVSARMQAQVLADKDATTHSRTGSSRKRYLQPSLSQKQDSFPQLTVVLRTDFYFKFEGPMQGRFLNWCVIARVQSWLECEKPF